MLKIKIIAVGKVKEKFFQAGIDEYVKRLQAFCRVEIIEVNEAKFAGVPNDQQIKKIADTEAERINSHIKRDDYVVAAMLKGKEFESEEFAQKISKVEMNSSVIDFVIGGSYGLPKNYSCDLSISFGKMTYPHQLFRLILCEQIYRAMMINNNRNYHK